MFLTHSKYGTICHTCKVIKSYFKMRYILMYVTALAFSLDFCGTAYALSVFLHVLTFYCHCKLSQSVAYKKRLTD